MKMVDRKIENLIEGDTFVHDGEFYFVLENTSISTSFNELKTRPKQVIGAVRCGRRVSQ